MLRDAQDFSENIGIRMEMPAFMKLETKQMPTLDFNMSRIVIKALFNAIRFQLILVILLNIYI